MKRTHLIYVYLCVTATAIVAQTPPIQLRTVEFLDQKLAAVQSSPACPNNICPGLGNSFYLPATNAASVNTGGRVFFMNRVLGDCVMMSEVKSGTRDFETADSMEQLISSSMTEAGLDGSYKTKVLSMSGTTSSMSGFSSDITTKFHSTHMDITTVTHATDFKHDMKCFAESNVDPEFLRNFQSLAPIIDASAAASWNPYVEFLKSNGSHIMMQQLIGSRFQQWESSNSEDSNIAEKLEIKACSDVEGTSPGGGWSVKSCGSYSKDEKEKALRTRSTSKRLILGSTRLARAALLKEVNKENLDAFIDAAEQGDEAVRFMFQPLWHLLHTIYQPKCAADGKGSAACQNLQRAVNLQAAYEGWSAVGCPLTKTSNGFVYQSMQIDGTTSLGINTYRCTVSKTGCRDNDDCHIGGFFRANCYCYGPSCIDTGAAIAGTPMHRDTVRGDYDDSSYTKGVNNSCYYKAGAHCDCDRSWSGGLPTRNLYQQSTPTFAGAPSEN